MRGLFSEKIHPAENQMMHQIRFLITVIIFLIAGKDFIYTGGLDWRHLKLIIRIFR